MAESVYATLLLNDSYLPGAQVLAHSLRDAGTTKKLAVLVTLTGVSERTVNELKKLYDYVIPVDPIFSPTQNNLHLMNRLDLDAALTKLNLWKQTQFSRIVYIDADILALRAPDELFDLDADFAAVPDVGWPDIFNSGMMVLKPDEPTFGELIGLAKEGKSFDGADQGLLNQHFENWHRLSFVYNCTIGPDLAYQYVPAYNHYGKNIALAHFIGDNKPWMRAPPTSSAPNGQSTSTSGPFGELTSKWWTAFGKHYGIPTYQEYDNAVFGTGVKNYGFLSSAKGDASERQYSAPGKYSTAQRGSSPSQTSAPQDSEGSTTPTQSRRSSLRLVQDAQEGEHPSVSILDDMADKHKGPESWPGGLPKRRPSARDVTFTPSTPPNVDNRTHYEQNLHGNPPDPVMTPEGWVPQIQWFRTGINSYHIQEYTENGVPLPVDPELVRQLSGKTIENIIDEIDSEAGIYRSFRAPQAEWDPTRSAPRIGGAPEAPNLRIESYPNEWDAPYKSMTHSRPWYEVPASQNPVFPWERQTRTVTRVFGDEPHPLLPAIVSARQRVEEEEEDHIEEDTAENQPIDDFDEFENKWDTDPAIRDYVYTLQHQDATIAQAVQPVDAVPAPAIRRHSSSEAARAQEDAPLDIDVEEKLRELQTLPKKLLVELLRMVLENEEHITLPVSRQNYADASVQTPADDAYAHSEQWEDSTVAPSSEGTEVPRKVSRKKTEEEAADADYFKLREQGMEKDKVLGWIHSKPGRDVDRVFPEDFEVGVVRPMSEFAMWQVPEGDS